MSAAAELLAEVRRLGGVLEFRPPDRIHYRLPPEQADRLLPAIREAKPELLRLLAASPRDPDPRAARWAGVTLATLGDRAITLTAPARDLPAPREWVKTPAGLGDLICWEASGAEGLVRLFRPRQGQAALVWFPAERI
ncbi:MAG TPA: hypothetical protein VE996_07165, partial [Terriglobales bacterium]|nr:hypothetical protein [Terriglobales bacterium]